MMAPLKILLTGANGFIGTALTTHLEQQGHHVLIATRNIHHAAADNALFWNPDDNELDGHKLAQLAPDAVVHLAGPTIGRYWWPAYKKYMMRNRIASARLLAEKISLMENRPQVFIGVSAIGYYGNSLMPVDEASPKGKGFASDLVKAMEDHLQPLKEMDIRTVHARMGVALGDGGALAQMLPPFKLGLGGPMGNGEQTMSWVALEDAVAAISTLITDARYKGAVNITSPNPVSNARFSRTLAQLLGRPCLLSMPELVVKTLFGQMGQELLLGGAPVLPKVLEKNGYTFKVPNLDEALRRALPH
ncbi:MAG: TIGR01777 family protein [Proteobacteria bacterium]|nr:TIGR01777 family protein [Pseudomonadota bacterium]